MTNLAIHATISLGVLDGTHTRAQMQAQIKKLTPKDRHYFSEFKLGDQTVLLVMIVDHEDGSAETIAYFEHKIDDPLNRPEFVSARDAMMRAYVKDAFGITGGKSAALSAVVREDGTVEDL